MSHKKDARLIRVNTFRERIKSPPISGFVVRFQLVDMYNKNSSIYIYKLVLLLLWVNRVLNNYVIVIPWVVPMYVEIIHEL